MPPPPGYTYHHNPWNAQQNRISPQNHYTNYHLQHPDMVQPHMYHQNRGYYPATVAHNQQQDIQNTGGFSNARPNIPTNSPHSQKLPNRKGLKNNYKTHNQLPPRFRNNQAQNNTNIDQQPNQDENRQENMPVLLTPGETGSKSTGTCTVHEQPTKPQIIENTNNQNCERKSQESVSNITSQPIPIDNLRNNDIGSVKNKDSHFLEDTRPLIPPDKMDLCQTPIRSPKMKEQLI